MHNFKKTALWTLALLLCVCILYGALTAPYFYGTYYFYEDAQVREDLAGSIDTLLLGASYTNWGIDPRTLDAELGCNSYNLGSSLQTMEGRYYLLQRELERNPVKMVIMETSAYALTRDREEEGPEGDLYMLARMGSLPERLKYFFTHFSVDEYADVFYDSVTRGLYSWKQLLLGGESQVKPETKGLHTYEFVDHQIYLSQIEHICETEPLSTVKNPEDVYYFEKCMELCREKGIRVVLVSMPISGRAILHFTGYDEIDDWYRAYAEQYDCTFLDFNLYRRKIWDIRDYDSYHDEFHLSDIGSERFTSILADFLRRDAAGEDLSGEFFEGYTEAKEEIIRRTYE